MSTAATDRAGVSGGLPAPDLSCSEDCLLRPGNTNCGGCGMSIALAMLGRALSDAGETCQLAIPACCGVVAVGSFPTSAYAAPTVATTFACSPAVASGMAAVKEMNREPGQVICWTGDGGTYDIGMASLSAAAERNENLLYFCYDNEIYGNTGGQRSSATPAGARTTTTPGGKGEAKKDMMAIMAAHRVPYAATLSIAHPDDFRRKLLTAFGTRGMKFLLIHSPCPTGWKSEPGDSVKLVRLAVRSGLFPLYEVFDGLRYRINVEPDWADPSEYYAHQRRFRKGEIDMDATRRMCRERFDRLKILAQAFPA